MDRKKLAFFVVLSASLCGVGCGGDDDGGPIDMCDTGDGHTYVMSFIDIGQADPTGDPMIVQGFDLDARVSDDTDEMGCFKPDFTSPSPDNEPGVDNQLGPILASLGGSFDVAGSISEALENGSIILLVDVQNVDDMANDSCVKVQLSLGMRAQAEPATSCMDDDECGDNVCGSASGMCEVPPMVDGTGRLVAGQAFPVNPIVTIPAVEGEIINGRVQAGPIDLSLAVPIDSETTLTLNINMAQFRFNISDGALDTGVIGGSLDIEETIAAITMAVMDVPEMLARSILEGQADLAPDAGGQCQAVSVGLIFDAVPATIQ